MTTKAKIEQLLRREGVQVTHHALDDRQFVEAAYVEKLEAIVKLVPELEDANAFAYELLRNEGGRDSKNFNKALDVLFKARAKLTTALAAYNEVKSKLEGKND